MKKMNKYMKDKSKKKYKTLRVYILKNITPSGISKNNENY